MHAQRGTDDDFFAEYPATPEEALAPEQLDRRLPLAWVLAVSDLDRPLAPAAPAVRFCLVCVAMEAPVDAPRALELEPGVFLLRARVRPKGIATGNRR